jgi:hypothetical protein
VPYSGLAGTRKEMSNDAGLFLATTSYLEHLANPGITKDAGSPLRFHLRVSVGYFAREQIGGDYLHLILASHQRPCVASCVFTVRSLISGRFSDLYDVVDNHARHFRLPTQAQPVKAILEVGYMI